MTIAASGKTGNAKLRALLHTQEKKRGFLVAFEGPDGSGKTTQRKLFKTWLRSVGHEVVTYRWNSSPLIEPVLKARKLARSLSPGEYCLLSAAAFRHQLETEVLPALWEGKMVVADRFLFTALARDTARGLDLSWVMNTYVPIFWQDMVFYFALSAEGSSERVGGHKKPSFYEAGQDVTNIDDPLQSHRQFVGRVIHEYEALSKIFQFLRIDARQSIYEQHRSIRQIFMQGHRRNWAEWNTEAVLSWLESRGKTPNVEIGQEKRKTLKEKFPEED